jgi:zinc protease
LLKQLESERITKARKFFSYLAAKDLGINYDTRKDTYAKVQTMTFDDLANFYQQNISGKNFIIMVMGNRDKLDMEYLKSLGDFKEVTLDEIFGY